MAKNVVFLVHGIGQHPAGWSNGPDGPATALSAARGHYPSCLPGDRPLSDQLELVEIRYDDVFDRVLDTWLELGQSIPATAGFPWVDQVKELLQSVNGKKESFLRYGGDVLLYCGFDLVARAVRWRVNSVIATRIYQSWLAVRDNPGAIPRFAVIAHSLGTTVAQDALYQLASAKWDDDLAEVAAQRPDMLANPALGGADRLAFDEVVARARAHPDRPIPVGLSALYLVANTWPLLRQVDGDYSRLQNNGAFDCARVYNINHAWDPVSLIGGGAAIVPSRPGWTNITVRHVHQPNIHGFGHYLSHPAVHAPMFARLVDPGFTATCALTAASLAQTPPWRGFGGSLGGLGAAAREDLEIRLRGLFSGDTTVRSLRAAIEQLAKQSGG